MWSWWADLFSFRQETAALASKSSQRAPSSSHTTIDGSEPQEEDPGTIARQQIGTLFCHYLLDANDPAIESTTGTQIFNKLSKAFAKPDVDTSTLPRRPSALPMLIKMLNDDNSDTRSLAGAILSDPNLTGKILQVANSPIFHIRPEPIESIDQAIFILGKDGIRNLVSTSLFSPMMKSQNKFQEAFTQKAWKWALVNAATAETLARYSNQNPSEYYLWGLFPPLAQLLIYQQTHTAYKALNERYLPEPAIVEKLLSAFVWPFCTQLAQSWKLPKRSRDVFSEMKYPEQYKRQHYPLADAITLSQALILNSLNHNKVSEELLASALQSPSQAITKATKTAMDKLTAC